MKYICKICRQVIDNNELCPFCGSDSSQIEPYSDEPKKYRCLNCGHELDNNEECPFCGATGNLIFDISSSLAEDDSVEQEAVEEKPVKNKPVFEYCDGDDCEGCCCDDNEDDLEDTGETHDEDCYSHQDSAEEDASEQHCCHNHDDEDEEHHCCHCHDSSDSTKVTAASFLADHSAEDSVEEHECHHCGKCHSETADDEENECCSCEEECSSSFEDMITNLLTVYGHLYVTNYEKAKAFKEYLMNFLREVSFDFQQCYDVDVAFKNLESNIYFKDIIKQFKE